MRKFKPLQQIMTAALIGAFVLTGMLIGTNAVRGICYRHSRTDGFAAIV